MAEVASAFVSIVPSARGFGTKLDAQVGGDLDKTGKKMGGRLGNAMKVGALAVLGGAALVGKFMGDALGEAREAQKVGALTASTIKATGGAAKISAKQVGDLSGAISAKSGIDDEAIQVGANMLLTFKNIRNEVGKGNDIFNQTAQAATDMSVAMGTDSKSSAILLGKALNDPVKGLSALTRVGVQFTDQQKAINKALVEGGELNALAAFGSPTTAADIAKVMKENNATLEEATALILGPVSKAQQKQFDHYTEGGHAMEAQKKILKELNSQFGGAAEAGATAGEKASVAFGNLKEQVGTALLPVVDDLANTFTDTVIPAVSGFVSGMQDGTGAGGKLVDIVKDVGSKVKATAGFIDEHRTAAAALTTVVVALVAITKIHSAVLAVQAAGGLAAMIKGLPIVTAVTKTWAAMQWLLNAALTANPVGIVVVAIAALVAGLIIAYKKSETFRKIVDGAFDAVAAAGRWLWNEVLQPVFKFLVEGFAFVMDMYAKLLEGLSHVPGFGWAGEAADAMGAAADKARDMADGIKDIPDKKKVTIKFTWDERNLQSILNKQAGDPRLDGTRATGGPVRSGGRYLVGEEGPELFVAQRSGFIVPNARIDESVTAGHNGALGGLALRGQLSIDRDGVAYVHGVARVEAEDVVATRAVMVRRAHLAGLRSAT